MLYKTLKKEIILILFCLLFLYVTRKIIDLYIIETEVNYLAISLMKLILLSVMIQFIKKEKKDIPVIFKNSSIFLLIIFVGTYLSYSNSEKIITLNGTDINLYLHVIFLFKCFVTGFFEETLFRVLLFNSILKSHFFLNKNTIFRSYIATSIIFGLVHLINLSSLDFFSVLNQILLAFGLGMIFQMLLTKYNNILFIASLHSLINYFGTRNAVLLHFKRTTDLEIFSNYEVFLNLAIFIFFDFIIIIYLRYFIKGQMDDGEKIPVTK